VAQNPLDRAAGLRDNLISDLRERGVLKGARLEAAFRNVPRHLFLPNVDLDLAYSDQAVSTKQQDGISISSASQPAIMALMLHQLDVHKGHKVLEIGAGTGYNAALLAHLVGPEGRVISVELDDDTAQAARDHLEAAGYADRVEVITGDGGYGYPEEAPYDRITLTVGAWDITPSWWTQLKSGGRLVLPISLRGPQVSAAFENQGGVLESISLEPCGFMELRGEFAAATTQILFGPEHSARIITEFPDAPHASAIKAWLSGPHQDIDTGFDVNPREVLRSMTTWLALSQPGFCTTLAVGPAINTRTLPPLFGYEENWRSQFGAGVLSTAGLCLLMRSPHAALPDNLLEGRRFRLWLRCCGNDPTLKSQVLHILNEWNTAGRPDTDALHLRAYPAQHHIQAEREEIILSRRWTILTAQWQV